MLDRLGVRADGCVFLDDLGINLKPARAMGMTTIKVVDPDAALRELEQVLGFALDESSTESHETRRRRGTLMHEPMRTMLQVNDLDETVNFYTKMLGFTLEATWGPDPHGPKTWCCDRLRPGVAHVHHGRQSRIRPARRSPGRSTSIRRTSTATSQHWSSEAFRP